MKIKELYKKDVLPKLKKEFGCKNDFQAPRLLKAVVNVGFGSKVKEKDFSQSVEQNLARITGQKPVLNKAKKAISAFKIREGMIIGASVTLRGDKMYDFLEKLIRVSFPRIRDFRGLDKKVIDRQGNMTIGFKDHLSFPEIRSDEMENIHGLEVSIATTAKSKKEGEELFSLLGFPFKKE